MTRKEKKMEKENIQQYFKFSDAQRIGGEGWKAGTWGGCPAMGLNRGRSSFVFASLPHNRRSVKVLLKKAYMMTVIIFHPETVGVTSFTCLPLLLLPLSSLLHSMVTLSKMCNKMIN